MPQPAKAVNESGDTIPAPALRIPSLLPPLAALGYPFLLMIFNKFIGLNGAASLPGTLLSLLLAFAVPLVGIVVANRGDITVGMRRLAYLSVAAPSLYVFLGVVQEIVGSPLPDALVWCLFWVGAMLLGWESRQTVETQARPVSGLGRWRVAHGISALLLCCYVLFHLANHLTGLVGPELHAQVMEAGRTVYRSSVVEPLLVTAFLFQVCSGLYLAWRWSTIWHRWLTTFQIASGVYLSVFVLGHMNSVFIYARSFLGIPTDWSFATGGETGLLMDPWNIRLVPHYTLGVFFVLTHLLAGLRVVLEAHGAAKRCINLLWYTGLGGAALLALAIIAGMCGVRI